MDRAAACKDGRRPRETSVTNSITVENSSSREYCRCRCSSNTASIQSLGRACSSATRVITLAGARCSKRSRTEFRMAPLPFLPAIVSRKMVPAQHPERGGCKGENRAGLASRPRSRDGLATPEGKRMQREQLESAPDAAADWPDQIYDLLKQHGI